MFSGKEIIIASQSLTRSALACALLISAGTLAGTHETRSRTGLTPKQNTESGADGTARTPARTTAPAKTSSNESRAPSASAIRSVKVTKDYSRGGIILATIELDGQATYNYFTLPSPYRLVMDVQHVSTDVPSVIQVGMSDLKRVRLGKMDDAVRIVFDAAKPQPYEISDEGSTIRIWFGDPTTLARQAIKTTPLNPVPSATVVVNAVTKPAKATAAPATSSQPQITLPTPPKPALAKASPAPISINNPVLKPSPVQLPTSPKALVKAFKPRTAASLFVLKLAPPTNGLSAKNNDAPPPPKIMPKAALSVATKPRPQSQVTPQVTPQVTQAAVAPAIARTAPGKSGARVVTSTPTPITTPVTTPVSTATPPVATTAPVRATAVKTSAAATKPDTPPTTTLTTPPTPVTAAVTAPTPPPRPREVTQTQATSQTKSFAANDYARQDFVGEPINLDLRSTQSKVIDIRDFLRFISDTYKVNFVIDQSVKDIPITVTLQSVPWNQAMEALLRANRLGVKVEGNILRVMSQETVALEDRLKQEQVRARQEATPLVTEMVRLNYARASTSGGGASAASGSSAGGGGSASGASSTAGGSGLDGIITSRLSARGKIQADPRTNTLIITDVPENVEAIKDIIAKLDVPEPQVEIESRIVIANRNFARDLGVQIGGTALNSTTGSRTSFSTLPGGATLSVGTEPADNLKAAGASSVLSLTTGLIGTARISAVLSAAESKGNVKTISSPRITALNNQTANIVNGVQIPVQTESNNTLTVTFVTAALRLEITPQINDNGNVLLKVVAENNSVNTAIATRSAPGINTQRAETTVLVPDGGTTIIGGINIDVESNSQQRTPGVSRIPGLGELFKRRTVSRQTDEILFFITPRIYRPLSAPTVTTSATQK